MAERFRDRVIVITGASRGIGRELALQLAGEGARLVLAARDSERLRMVVGECSARGVRAVDVPTDVADAAACRRLIESAVKTFGSLDVLINNAGISMFARFAAVRDLGMLEHILRVNFLGSMYCTGHALPYLRQTQGRIVGVGSLVSKVPGPGGTGYVASKHALRGFYDSLRAELRADRVSVTVAYPGFVRTEIYRRFLDAEGGYGPDRSGRIPRWVMMSVERCARRIIEAARRRRREVPPTIWERGMLACNWLPAPLLELFWQRPLRRNLPPLPAADTSNADHTPLLKPIADAPPADGV
jgi:short-subunit dehydrogenase